MNSNFSKTMKKVFEVIDNLHEISRKILKIGLSFFVIVFLISLILLTYNKILLNDDTIYYTSITMLKSSFTVLSQVLFGSLLIDFVIKKFEEDE
ncbi:MAG: hypothetical protein ABF289_11680 [Clostridiales bacterium]